MNRRGFITGLASLVCAAPAVVRAASLMPVRAIQPWDTNAIADLLCRRIDETYRMLARNMADSIYRDVGLPPLGGFASLFDDPVKCGAIADEPYVRFAAFEPVAPLVANYRPHEAGSFAMRFPAPRRIEFVRG